MDSKETKGFGNFVLQNYYCNQETIPEKKNSSGTPSLSKNSHGSPEESENFRKLSDEVSKLVGEPVRKISNNKSGKKKEGKKVLEGESEGELKIIKEESTSTKKNTGTCPYDNDESGDSM